MTKTAVGSADDDEPVNGRLQRASDDLAKLVAELRASFKKSHEESMRFEPIEDLIRILAQSKSFMNDGNVNVHKLEQTMRRYGWTHSSNRGE